MSATPTPGTPRRPVAPAGPPMPPSSPVGSQGSVGDVSCAICLEHAEQEQLAMVKGCDHSYCGACDATWSQAKPPGCCASHLAHRFSMPRQGCHWHRRLARISITAIDLPEGMSILTLFTFSSRDEP